MALELRDPGDDPGHALLVFDHPIEVDHLPISVLNLINGRYLGPSVPGKIIWTAQPHFFTASRVSGAAEAAFQIGPEITSFIAEETIVEFATADGTIKERIPWRGIQMYAWLSAAPVAASALPAPAMLGDLSRKADELVAKPPRAIAAPPVHIVEPPEVVDTVVPPSAVITPLAPASPNRRRFGLLVILLLPMLVAAAFILESDWGHRLVCRGVGGCREDAMFASAQTCAASKTCGALTCTDEYRRSYPAGRFLQQVRAIDAEKGRVCERVADVQQPVPNPPQPPSLQPAPTEPRPISFPPPSTILMHNGSRVEMVRTGNDIEIRYKNVRPGLSATSGDVLFTGTMSAGGRISGIAYVFKRGCSSVGYDVSGRQSGNKVVLSGDAPIHAPQSCGIARYDAQSSNARLEFTVED